MGTYLVTDPNTGKKLKLTGDSPPSEQELEQVFASHKSNANNSDLANLITGKKKPISGIHVPGFSADSGLFSQIGDAVLPSEATRMMLPSNVRDTLDFADAAQHHAMNLPYGLAQTIEHGLEYGSGKLLGDGSPITRSLHNDNARSDREMVDRETAYQARVQNSPASYAGATLGEIGPWAFGAPEKALASITERIAPAGSGVAKRMAAGAVTGGTIAAAQPVVGGNYSDEKKNQLLIAAATGGLLPAGLGTALGIKNGVSDIYNMIKRPDKVANKVFAKVYGSDNKTLASLQNAPEYVQGEKITAAQAIKTPEAVMAEKALRNRADMKAGFEHADNHNNDLRMEVIQKIAGTPDELKAAKNKRSAEYQQFSDDTLKAGPENQRYLKASQILGNGKAGRMSSSDFDSLNKARIISEKVHKGAMTEADAEQAYKALSFQSKKAQTVFDQARTAIHKNMINPKATLKKLEELSINTNKIVRESAKEQLTNLRANMDTRGLIPAHVLDGVRENANKTLADVAAKHGTLSTKEAAIYGSVPSTIVREIERKLPGHRSNLRAYRDNSVPINTMEAGNKILEPISHRGDNSVGAKTLTLNDVAQGFKRDSKARYAMSPEAKQNLTAVENSLQRRATSDSIRSPSSDTAYNLDANSWMARKLFGNNLQGGNAGKTLGMMAGGGLGAHFYGSGGAAIGAPLGAGLGAVIDGQIQKLNARIADRVGKGAVDSKEAARMIEQFLKDNPRNRQQLLKAYPQWVALLGADRQKSIEAH